MEQTSSINFDLQSLLDYENISSRAESKSMVKQLSQKIKNCFYLLFTAPLHWFLEQINKRHQHKPSQRTNQPRQLPQTFALIDMYKSFRSKCVASLQILQSIGTIVVICVQSLISLLISIWLMSFSVLQLLIWLRVDFEEWQKMIPFIMVVILTVMAVTPFCLQAFYQEHVPH